MFHLETHVQFLLLLIVTEFDNKSLTDYSATYKNKIDIVKDIKHYIHRRFNLGELCAHRVYVNYNHTNCDFRALSNVCGPDSRWRQTRRSGVDLCTETTVYMQITATVYFNCLRENETQIANLLPHVQSHNTSKTLIK